MSNSSLRIIKYWDLLRGDLSLTRKIFVFIFLLLLLYLPCTSFAGQQYTITAEELTALDSRLQQQEILINKSKAELNNLKQQLTTSQQRLTEAKQQSAQLQKQLDVLKKTSQMQQGLIESANQSLARYEEEMQAQQKKIKRERNTAYIILAGAVMLAIKN